MAGKIDAKLTEMGIDVPPAYAPKVAKILNWKIAGDMLYVSGQVPRVDGEISYIGKVGREFTLEEGQEAARVSALCVLGAAKEALDGDLDRVAEIVKLTGFINVDPEFKPVSAVMNGASELFIELFGDPGRHARTAIGVASMPFGVAIEVEAIIRISS